MAEADVWRSIVRKHGLYCSSECTFRESRGRVHIVISDIPEVVAISSRNDVSDRRRGEVRRQDNGVSLAVLVEECLAGIGRGSHVVFKGRRPTGLREL